MKNHDVMNSKIRKRLFTLLIPAVDILLLIDRNQVFATGLSKSTIHLNESCYFLLQTFGINCSKAAVNDERRSAILDEC